MARILDVARERKLDRAAAAYAVAGWVAVQAASIALPAFDAPGWLLKWLIAVAVLGLPVVLAVAWVVGARAKATIRTPPLGG